MKTFKKNDKVLIFDCIECPGGTVGIVIDKDISENTFMRHMVRCNVL